MSVFLLDATEGQGFAALLETTHVQLEIAQLVAQQELMLHGLGSGFNLTKPSLIHPDACGLYVAADLVIHGVQMGHIVHRLVMLLVAEEYRKSVRQVVVRRVRHDPITLLALIKVVAWLVAGSEKAGSRQDTEYFEGTQAVFHPQRKQVELIVLDDNFHASQGRLVSAQVVTEGTEFNRPSCLITHAEVN
jgi:hypothetical protein